MIHRQESWEGCLYCRNICGCLEVCTLCFPKQGRKGSLFHLPSRKVNFQFLSQNLSVVQKTVISVGEDLALALLAVSTARSRLGGEANFQRLEGSNLPHCINFKRIDTPLHHLFLFFWKMVAGCWIRSTSQESSWAQGSMICCLYLRCWWPELFLWWNCSGLYQTSTWASLFKAPLPGYFSSTKW